MVVGLTHSTFKDGKAGHTGKGLALISKGEEKHMLSTKVGKLVSIVLQPECSPSLDSITLRWISPATSPAFT